MPRNKPKTNNERKAFQGYVFIQRDYDGNEVRHEISSLDVDLPYLLKHFGYFLKGCSFHLPFIDNPIIVDEEPEIEIERMNT